VPVLVRCGAPYGGRACKVVITPRLRLHVNGVVEDAAPASSSSSGLQAAVSPMTLRFSPALQVSFEDRGLSSMGFRAGLPASALPRKFTLKAAASLELDSVMATAPTPGASAVQALGVIGRIEATAVHAFALPPGDLQTADECGTLRVCFRRADLAAAFAPWASDNDNTMVTELQRSVGALPGAASDWPIPRETPEGLQHGSATGLRVDLEHGTTGTVAEPIVVRVRVMRSKSQGVHELKVRVLQGESGEGSDKFFISGPTSTQAVPSSFGDEPQICATFALVPLRPGWLSLPRVQVSAGNREAASVPTNIFVFPASQPMLWRSGG